MSKSGAFCAQEKQDSGNGKSRTGLENAASQLVRCDSDKRAGLNSRNVRVFGWDDFVIFKKLFKFHLLIGSYENYSATNRKRSI